MFSWLCKFAKNPRIIGSVAPSSPSLAKLMTDDLRPKSKILELGPGNGAITGFAVQKIASPTQLTLIEIEPDLAHECRNKFPGVKVVCDDVENVLQKDNEHYDFILSGVPFAVMNIEKRKQIFNLINNRLKPNGVFIMFQYSLTTLNELRDIFDKVDTKFTPWNIPPAVVYFCHKKSPTAITQSGMSITSETPRL